MLIQYEYIIIITKYRFYNKIVLHQITYITNIKYKNI